VIEFIIWLLTLPFQILGVILSIVFGILGAVISVVASIIGAAFGLIWAALCIGAVVLLVMGVIKMLDQRATVAR
jgi:hypothetical protein